MTAPRYGRVNLSIAAIVASALGEPVPDRVPLNGEAILRPRLAGGGVEVGRGADGEEVQVPLPVSCQVLDGVLTQGSLPYVTLLVPTDGWEWEITFSGFATGDLPILLEAFTFPVIEATQSQLDDVEYAGTSIAQFASQRYSSPTLSPASDQAVGQMLTILAAVNHSATYANARAGASSDSAAAAATSAQEAADSAQLAALVWRGDWDAGTEYLANDAVHHDGSTWRALRTSTGDTPVPGPDWALLAARGETGPQSYAAIPQVEAEAGTSTTDRVITAARLKGAIQHWATGTYSTAISAIGQALNRAATAADARTAIGAGTSDLAIGTTSTTAKAGNYVPTWTEVTSKPTTFPPDAHTHARMDAAPATWYWTGTSLPSAASEVHAQARVGDMIVAPNLTTDPGWHRITGV